MDMFQTPTFVLYPWVVSSTWQTRARVEQLLLYFHSQRTVAFQAWTSCFRLPVTGATGHTKKKQQNNKQKN